MSRDLFSPDFQKFWRAASIRGCMILAVNMQILLALLSPRRKKTSNPFSIFLVWFAYLFADWTAVFAYGLITNHGCKGSADKYCVRDDYLALWAAFLLVHLGGPDSMVAFSLEDNSLWMRQLIGLVAQISASLFIFGKVSRHNDLLVPTILMFVAGVIKYSEKARALYLASSERMKKYGENPLLELDPSDIHSSWRSAYAFFHVLKGLVVDIMPSSSKLTESRGFFLNEDAATALEVLAKEMSFLYDMLYTKTLALCSRWGLLSRAIADLIIVAVSSWFWFYLLRKLKKTETDHIITALLASEALAFLLLSRAMLFCRPWKFDDFSDLRIFRHVGVRIKVKLWSEAVGSFDLLTYCFKECTRREGHWLMDVLGSIAEKISMTEVIAEFKHVSKVSLDIQLWRFVYDELRAKALWMSDNDPLVIDIERTRVVYEARGNLALVKPDRDDLMRFIRDYEFDSTLLMWHIATQICYHLDEGPSNQNIDSRTFSETISSYMVYIMVKQPELMSPVIDMGYVRYRETCADIKRRGRGFVPTNMREFPVGILAQGEDGRDERSKSVLLNSCVLARVLLSKDTKWEIISEVWVELLSYAAGHCRADSYARLLTEGGEFIGFVWLLMAHLGIGRHVPIK